MDTTDTDIKENTSSSEIQPSTTPPPPAAVNVRTFPLTGFQKPLGIYFSIFLVLSKLVSIMCNIACHR